MATDSQSTPNRARAAAWTLLVGPGERLRTLPGVLASLLVGHGEGGPEPPSELLELASADDLVDAEGAHGAFGRALLDVDALPLEDLGMVRRFVERRPGWELVITGSEDRSRGARLLLGLPRARWCAWPLDIDQLKRALEPPEAAAASASGESPAARDEEHGSGWTSEAAPIADGGIDGGIDDGSDEEEPFGDAAWDAGDDPAQDELSAIPAQHHTLERDLAAIEAILAGAEGELGGDVDTILDAPPELEGDPAGLDLTREELQAFFDPDPLPEATELEEALPEAPPEAPSPAPAQASAEDHADDREADVAPTSAPAFHPPPPWYRDQVADLADLAQRLDLSLGILREKAFEADVLGAEPAGGGIDRASLDRLDGDVFRLVQFTRTLGYLAAPPALGQQEIALSTLLEEQLGGLAGSGAESPRYLFRGDDEVRIASDKSLLVQAFDAVLQVASACSGPDEVVRVSVDTTDGFAQVLVTFPAGPLDSVAAERALSPYGLRRALPQIGSNALAAAARILEGQGGSLALGDDERPDRRAFLVRLPRA